MFWPIWPSSHVTIVVITHMHHTKRTMTMGYSSAQLGLHAKIDLNQDDRHTAVSKTQQFLMLMMAIQAETCSMI
jgi:hypothetical protein